MGGSSTSANKHTLLMCGLWGWPNLTMRVSGLIRNKGSHSGSVMGVVRSVHALCLVNVENGSHVSFALNSRWMLISISLCVLLIQSSHVHVIGLQKI